MLGHSTSCNSVAHRAAALGALVLSSAALAACTEPAPPSVGTSAEALTRTVTIRRGSFGSVADTYVSSSSMKKNFGDKHKLLVSARNEALLRFDLASIPDNAVIDQATLILTINGGEEEDDDDCHDGDHEGHHIAPIKVRRVTAPWTEGTVTYRNFQQQFAPAVVGTLLLSNRSSTKRVDVRALVQGWVAGTYPNHGLVLTTAGRQHTLIVASEQHHAGRRPALELQYTTPDDHCEADPCVHGACTNLPDGFTCACEPGWTGPACDNDIDDCAGAPCQHGGTCTDLDNGYTCACAPGYAGANCETDVDDCAPGPCANDGVCTDGVDDFTCACPAGWGGETCADDLDSCVAAPCLNGATCTDQPGGFTCTCAPGFVGALCETNPDDCAGVVCQNGGTCEDGAGAFTCDCPAGYGGALCEINLDDCVANACGHGACIDQVDGYTCACEPGFAGATCELDIDDCASDPCGAGTCTDLVNGYACQCAGGVYGATCDQTCAPGTVPAPDGLSCVACPLGTYQSASPWACTACPANTYAAAEGATACLPCAPGTGAPPGSASCAPSGGDLSCPPGSEPAPDLQSCVACPDGSISEGIACEACPDGTYASNDRTACLPAGLAETQLSAPEAVGVPQIWQPFEVSTVLSRTVPPSPLAGETVWFKLDGPLANPEWAAGVTDSEGRASAPFFVRVKGQYPVTAYYNGSPVLLPATSVAAPVSVYEPTDLWLSPIQPNLLEARLVRFPDGKSPSGFEGNAYSLAGQTVTFDGWGAGPVSAVTDAAGVARVAVALPPGPLTVTATFFNPADSYARTDGALAPTIAGRGYSAACPPNQEPSSDLASCVPVLSGPHSSAVGAGTTSAQVNVPALFTVIVRDASGAQVAPALGCAAVSARITGTAEDTPDCIDNGDGTLTYLYTPLFAGAYILTITVEHANVQGSPFALTVS